MSSSILLKKSGGRLDTLITSLGYLHLSFRNNVIVSQNFNYLCSTSLWVATIQTLSKNGEQRWVKTMTGCHICNLGKLKKIVVKGKSPK